MYFHRSHAFHKLFYHIVWTTKNRELLITSPLEERLYAYLRKKIYELEGNLIALNGIEDHLHLLVQLAPKNSPSKFVKDIKGSSSHFLTHEVGPDSCFKWQQGYAIFSVGEREVPKIRAYIEKQKEHHQSKTTEAKWEYKALNESE